MSNTRIMRCGCKSAFQDSEYGRGKRVFNQGAGGRGEGLWRCTACGATRFADRDPTQAIPKQTKTKSKMGAKKRGLKGRKSSGGKKAR